jgi:hypothetical protein
MFVYDDARPETLRLVGNAPVWEHGELTLRLEGDIPLDEALRIGASLR